MAAFFNGPAGPATLRSSFRTARGFASILIALSLVFCFLYAYQVYFIPHPDSDAYKISIQPQSPLHSGLSDAVSPYLDDVELAVPHPEQFSHDEPSEDLPSEDLPSEDLPSEDLSEAVTSSSSIPSTSSSSSASSISSTTSTSSISAASAASPASSSPSSSFSTSSTSTPSSSTPSSTNEDEEIKKPVKFVEDQSESGSTGKAPENHNDLTTTIVVGRVDDNPGGVRWIKDLLRDITNSAIYIVDDPGAPLHLNQNKGREAMVYMKYIMDYYDKLSDVTIFFHSSRMAWHNNMLAFKDGAVMINNLRRSHVMEAGYFNMRCELHPGCPHWIKFNASREENMQYHPERFNDLFTVQIWDQMFPNRTHDPVYLGSPCCSQFAVSREKIRSIPHETFVRVHDFLAESQISDGYLGRIMEYVWGFLFMDQDELCPSMQECYCKGYGQCLPNDAAEDLVEFNSQRMEEEDQLTKLGAWDYQNCHEKEEGEERNECKKDNPFHEPLSAARRKAAALADQLHASYGIKDP